MASSLKTKAKRMRKNGWSYAAIAAEVGKSVATVQKWVNPTAKKRLKEAWNKWRKSPRGRVKLNLCMGKARAVQGGFEPCSASADEVLAALVADCPICLTENADMVIDHCHETGKFRGWICRSCNGALGLLQDDIKTLRRAIAYLS